MSKATPRSRLDTMTVVLALVFCNRRFGFGVGLGPCYLNLGLVDLVEVNLGLDLGLARILQSSYFFPQIL